MSTTKLWMGGGALFVGAFTAKQLMWHRISSDVLEIRAQEHGKAVAVLKETREKAMEYNLQPLTNQEKQKVMAMSSAPDKKL